MSTPSVTTPIRHDRSAYRAGFLSFLWPGLGQWYTGRTRTAALFALPVIGIGLLMLLQAIGGLGQTASLLLTPSSALTVVILIGLLAAWRHLAIAEAMSTEHWAFVSLAPGVPTGTPTNGPNQSSPASFTSRMPWLMRLYSTRQEDFAV